jgi:hypothetical protein
VRRRWQYFEAPGDPDLPLSETQSPWVVGRLVTLPLEHWELLLDWVSRVDSPTAEMLKSISYGAPGEDSRITNLSADEILCLTCSLDALAARLQSGPDLTTESTDEVPDVLASEEHARMLRNVATAFRESLRLQAPVRGWED